MKLKIERIKSVITTTQFRDILPLETFLYTGKLYIKTKTLIVELYDYCYEYNALCLDDGEIVNFTGCESVIPRSALLQIEEW